MIKIDCKKYAEEILSRVAVKTAANKLGVGSLLILTTGHDPASEVYVRGKLKDAEKCGLVANKLVVRAQKELYDTIYYGNDNQFVSGIIVQLPLPKGWDEKKVVSRVASDKDVDGFQENSPFDPCTPEAIMYLLKKELGDLTGKRALVIGRGKLVGKPIAKMLLDADCTVTVAHSKSEFLAYMLYEYDVIISAVGKPNVVNLLDCNENAIVIDVGISTDENGKLCGDCCGFDEKESSELKVAMMPGGIGLLTRAVLMAHVAHIDIFRE